MARILTTHAGSLIRPQELLGQSVEVHGGLGPELHCAPDPGHALGQIDVRHRQAPSRRRGLVRRRIDAPLIRAARPPQKRARAFGDGAGYPP